MSTPSALTSQTAFVSGANGFIAQHLIILLLSKKFNVIGSVRTEEKGERLKLLFKEGFDYVVIPEIAEETAFDKVFQDNPQITVFFHAASPFFYSDNNLEKDILIPAINGTKNALRSAKAYGKNIERVVLTSSFFAVGFSATLTPISVITEESWTQLTWEQSKSNSFFTYAGSKTLAEKAAWQFMEVEMPHFDLAVINPTYVFGPQAFDSEVRETLSSSAEYVNQLLKLKATDPLPSFQGIYSDVRDVAKAHFVAHKGKAASNKRILLANGIYTSQLIANILREKFPELQNVVPRGNPVNTSEGLKHVYVAIIDDEKSRKILGFEQTPFEESVADAANQILRVRKKVYETVHPAEKGGIV